LFGVVSEFVARLARWLHFERDDSIKQIHAELDFMQHLVRHGYPSMVVVFIGQFH
jgi:hypothetical protein